MTCLYNFGMSCIIFKHVNGKVRIDMQKFMYVSLFSNYGGFLTYTTLEKGNSMSIEHSF